MSSTTSLLQLQGSQQNSVRRNRPTTQAVFYIERYILKRQLKSLGIFYAIFLVFAFVVPMFIMMAGMQNQEGRTDIIVATLIFAALTVGIGATQDFKLQVQFGFSRIRCFWMLVLNAFLSSFTLALTTVFLSWFVPLIKVNGNTVYLQTLLVSLYSGGDKYLSSTEYGSVFAMCFGLFFFVAALGILVALFLEKTGVLGRIVAAACCVALPMLSKMVWEVLSDDARRSSENFFMKILGIDFAHFEFNKWPLLGTLAVLSIILFAVTYLLNRRREVKRVNA